MCLQLPVVYFGQQFPPLYQWVIGVYVLTGAQSEFKQVEILADDGDFYLVRASLPDNPTELQIKKAFRAGDEVIVSSEEIYDGKVILAPR